MKCNTCNPIRSADVRRTQQVPPTPARRPACSSKGATFAPSLGCCTARPAPSAARFAATPCRGTPACLPKRVVCSDAGMPAQPPNSPAQDLGLRPGPGPGDGPLPGADSGHEGGGVLLRPAQPLAKGQQRKHQRPGAPVPAQGHGLERLQPGAA